MSSLSTVHQHVWAHSPLSGRPQAQPSSPAPHAHAALCTQETLSHGCLCLCENCANESPQHSYKVGSGQERPRGSCGQVLTVSCFRASLPWNEGRASQRKRLTVNSRKLRNGRCALSPAPPHPPQLVSWKGPASSQVRLASHHGFPRPHLLCCLLRIPHTHPPTWQPVSTLGPRQCPELKHRVRYILAIHTGQIGWTRSVGRIYGFHSSLCLWS